MASLKERFSGDFRKICEHFSEVLLKNNKLLPKDKDEFYNWMMTKEDLFPRLLICADPRFYSQAFYVQKKLADDTQEQQHLMIVGGKVGKGKTTLASQFCSLVDPTYCRERVCYLPHQFFKVVTVLNPGEAVHIDEGGNFFKALNTSTKASKYLGQYFQMARAKRLLIVINYDDYEKMNKEIREKADCIVYKIPDPRVQGSSKFAKYWWYKGRSVQAINNYYNSKRKLPLTHKEMLRYISYKGDNHKDYPIINDLNEKSFKENKMKYVKVFEDIMLNEFDDLVTESEKKEQQQELENKFLPLREIKKRLGVGDHILKKFREDKPECCLQLGNGYRYNEQKVIEYLSFGRKTPQNTAN